MTTARQVWELTREELLALIREGVRAELGQPAPVRTERPSVVDREPPPEAYARVMARRRRRGR